MTTPERVSLHVIVPVWILLVLVVSGCAQKVNAGPPPTRTPIPTFTPSPTYDVLATMVFEASAATATAEAPTITPTPTETETPTVTPTDTPEVAQVIIPRTINVRVGPSTLHAVIGSADSGESYPILGKSNDGTWWQIDYNGQTGWVFAEIVEQKAATGVPVAVNIPTLPPPPPTWTPTITPTPEFTPTPVFTPTPTPNYTYKLVDKGTCESTDGLPQFQGTIEYNDGSPRNLTCVHIAFWGPRQTQCSGCDRAGDGNWGFAPFGESAPADTTVEIYVVNCPTSGVPPGGQNSDFVNLTPLSPSWFHKVNGKELCTDIAFVSED
ncbi:MAG: SH3 domain-containing protein [Caldilineaceae bacterium]|nr:SH3 domain-containing protein [Caldilineaceae bacterium]